MKTDLADKFAALKIEMEALEAELSAVKDRLATVERIVTDGSLRLDREIEQLRGPRN